jgi:hypothetical protein
LGGGAFLLELLDARGAAVDVLVCSSSSASSADRVPFFDFRIDGGREAWARARAPNDIEAISTSAGVSSSSSDYGEGQS